MQGTNGEQDKSRTAGYDDIRSVAEARATICKGTKLGSGGFANVFRAVQSDTQRVVALKQSRASLRLKRPLLQHEAKVLRYLSGHPSIPEVYAYGRIEHFELMSMQLLHRSLRNALDEDGPLSVKSVADIADQMMDALQYVHSHGLVHRDIKPDNIMLQSPGSWKLCLIDFGLTHHLPSLLTSTTSTLHADPSLMPDRPAYLFGTLLFATLLTFRDDIESLAYTLLWVLRGDLPWSHFATNGNRVGRIRQVQAQKKRHTGSTMATELPTEFGELVDYARSLRTYENPGYDEWRRRFKQVEKSPTWTDAPTLQLQAPQISIVRPDPPMEVGQVVLIKLDPFVTGDGYTIREGHESSFIPDSFYDSPDWSTMSRPAVVAQVEWDERARKYSFLAIAISRNLGTDEGTSSQAIPIASGGSTGSNALAAVHTEPEWPLGGSSFYVYKRPVKFYCLPSQASVRLPSIVHLINADCSSLLNALAPPPDLLSTSQEAKDLESPDSDIRHDARVRRWAGYCNLYAQVQPLTSAHLDDNSIDWFSKRAWFDECVKIQRHKTLHGGIWWTDAWFPSVYRPKEGDVEESYFESDFSMWKPQAERSESITLAIGDGDTESVGDVPQGLTKIVGLEQES
ncbi:hypothetical protein RSOLAG22IIIB_09000 [Rhizoctonia solani]|uniref:non-specific serine/threonine protein kinase n=1 Tax=Rhizoctonia solani TaxID=456999 RepID=A0A0K6FWF8_9AGAM|nr:hypothetical protein RSOLAG22IIIB_09000 [Rhizoctonia solani]